MESEERVVPGDPEPDEAVPAAVVESLAPPMAEFESEDSAGTSEVSSYTEPLVEPIGDAIEQLEPAALSVVEEPAEPSAFPAPDGFGVGPWPAILADGGEPSEADALQAPEEEVAPPEPARPRDWLDVTPVDPPAPTLTEAGMLFADVVSTPPELAGQARESGRGRPAPSRGRTFFRLFVAVFVLSASLLSALLATQTGAH